MRSIYGTDAKGNTTIVGEMDDSVLAGIAGESSGCGGKKKAGESSMGKSKKKKKRGNTDSFEARKAKLVTKKPGKNTPQGDEDQITDPDNNTPAGIGNTAKDKKKGKSAGESSGCGGKKKKGC